MFDEGYLIFDDEGDELTHKFDITDKEISLAYGSSRNSKDTSCRICYFVNDKEYDEGWYETREEYNKSFKEWKMVKPENIIRLKFKKR